MPPPPKTAPDAPPTCPHDEQPLTPVEAGPQTPPWLCESCSRLWWPSELTPASRKAWDPKTRSYARGEAGDMARLHAQVDRAEKVTAHENRLRARERGSGRG